MAFVFKPEDDFADLIWGENQRLRTTIKRRTGTRRKPIPVLPSDRRIPSEFSKYLRDKQRRVEEAEAAEILSFNKRMDKIKSLIMNVIIPVFVIVTILIIGAVIFMPDKKIENFDKQITTGESATTLQLQETPKKGNPTITRSE